MNTWWFLTVEQKLAFRLCSQSRHTKCCSYKVTLPGSETDRSHLKIKCLKVQQVRVSLIVTNQKRLCEVPVTAGILLSSLLKQVGYKASATVDQTVFSVEDTGKRGGKSASL